MSADYCTETAQHLVHKVVRGEVKSLKLRKVQDSAVKPSRVLKSPHLWIRAGTRGLQVGRLSKVQRGCAIPQFSA